MRKVNEDLTKLPKWAQRRIDVLTRNVDYFEKKLNTVKCGESGISYTENWQKEYFLPEGSKIVFRFGGQEISVYRKHHDDALMVMGNGTIVVLPDTSNVVRILEMKPLPSAGR